LNVGQADKAQEVLKQVVAKRKSNRRYLFHLAVANYRLGDLEAARRVFSQAKGLSLAEEVLTPSERQLLARLERDLDKSAPKGTTID
jgi:Flp pilus assembly protein TadD